MKKADITALVKALQSAKTLEEQREVFAEIGKIVNKKTKEEKAQDKEEQLKKSAERLTKHNKRDLLTLSALTKLLSKTDIQFFELKAEPSDPNVIRSVNKPHVSKVARIKEGLSEEEWDKLTEPEQSSLIKKHGKFSKELLKKFNKAIQSLNSRTGFNGTKFSVDPDAKGITYRSEFRKEKKA